MKAWLFVATWSVLAGIAASIGASCGKPAPVNPCHIQAALQLPLDDPDAITVGDAKALATRLKACSAGDAGL